MITSHQTISFTELFTASNISNAGSGNLNGRKVLITNGCTGVGRAMAIAFAREGADVLISYQNEEDAQETAKCVAETGKKAYLLPGDIANEEQCKQLVPDAVQKFGSLDILVNNAALPLDSEFFTNSSPEELDRNFRNNLYTMYNLCHTAVAHLKPGSLIINTTLSNTDTPTETLLSYSVEQKAIQNFTSSLAHLVAEKGIRVNCFALDSTHTALATPAILADQLLAV